MCLSKSLYSFAFCYLRVITLRYDSRSIDGIMFSEPIIVCRMDPASVALTEGLDPSKPRIYAALSEFSNVPPSTL
jgi:hypothetical protein